MEKTHPQKPEEQKPKFDKYGQIIQESGGKADEQLNAPVGRNLQLEVDELVDTDNFDPNDPDIDSELRAQLEEKKKADAIAVEHRAELRKRLLGQD